MLKPVTKKVANLARRLSGRAASTIHNNLGQNVENFETATCPNYLSLTGVFLGGGV